MVLLIFFLTSPAVADDLNVQISFAELDNQILANIEYEIPQEFHAYSHEPNLEGLPTTLSFNLDNIGAVPVLYPKGVSEKDIYDTTKIISAYRGRINLIAILPPDAKQKKYSGKLKMLLCSNKRCQPIDYSFNEQVPENISKISEVSWKNLPLLKQLEDFIQNTTLEKGEPPKPISIETKMSEMVLHAIPDNVLEPPDEFDLHLKPMYLNPGLEIYSLGKAILLGLLAGLILNAMPCVLPVLALKVNGILFANNVSNKEKVKLFRQHNLFFAAGVLTLFTFLAIFLGMADLMWGQLFQSQLIIVILLLIVFLLSLSMLGVFTLPTFDFGFGQHSANAKLEAYTSGLLCTFLATPCSGPLLGGVLAWSFGQSALILLTVFWAVGLGMSLPYIFFSIWPRLIMILPRPGNWMYIFEHILGFLLLGTTLYLLSILQQDKQLHVLCALLAVAFLAWLWGKFCNLDAPSWRRRGGAVFGLLFLTLVVVWVLQPPDAKPKWINFEPAAFTESLGNKNMLVEFTADWCPNCKYLERTALTEENLEQLKKKYNLELIKVDITNSNPYAEKLLSMLGARSIPVTAIFSAGKTADQPLVLRDIYNFETLKKAVENKFSSASS